MKNTKLIGERTEAIVLAELLKIGKVVLLPFGDNQRYDMVIDEDGKFIRVQCKTARLDRGRETGSIIFNARSANRAGTERHYKGQADMFAVYYPGNKKVYMVPVDDVGHTVVALRLEPCHNKQVKGIRNAEDYELK